MLRGLMMDFPLTISALLRHAEREFGEQEIVSRTVDGDVVRETYREAASRARRMAKALRRMGVKAGDRVATIAWNTHRHFELYYAITGIGAVCHTLNPRYSIEQIQFILKQAEDSIVFFDKSFLPLVSKLSPEILAGVRLICLDTVPADKLPASIQIDHYEEILQAENDALEWPVLDEQTAAILCYTSGTTGNPKGALYSHRSMVLQALVCSHQDNFGIAARDVVLPVVPLFHVSAWGIPFVACLTGAKLVLPGPFLDPESLANLIGDEQVTFSAGIPTIWLGLLAYLEATGRTLPSLKRVAVGGSASPRKLIAGFETGHGIEVTQGWGMTETNAVGTVCTVKPKQMESYGTEALLDLKTKQGHAIFGTEVRITDDNGEELPRDGRCAGQLCIRGPWVARAYFKADTDCLDKAGWFPTGDVASIDPDGYVQIVDRSKDLIKSGGEWISSVAVENAVLDHPSIAQAAVIAIADPKWSERPALIAMRTPLAAVTEDEIKEFLASRIPRWQIPDHVVFVDALPTGATGKVLKQKLRET